MRLATWPLVLAIVAMSAPAGAHETWLLPQQFVALPPHTVTLHLTSGMAFATPEHGIHADRVAQARARIGGRLRDLVIGERSESVLTSTLAVDRPGLATVWFALHPRELVLEEDKIEEYLDEIAAPETIRAQAAQQRGKHPWRETYTKYAKSFIVVRGPGQDDSWREPAGLALELVPREDPARARVGEELTLRLLHRGEPKAGLAVGVMHAGKPLRVFRITDAQGDVHLPLSEAGPTLAYAVDLRLAGDGVSWVSDFTTLTFDTLPRR